MPKVNRNGQAAVLSDDQLAELFETLDPPHRLIFQICYHTAARIGEVVQLQRSDIINGRILYRAKNTKTKKTRDVIISPPLAQLLLDANLPQQGYIFPSRDGSGHMTTQATDLALRNTCDYIGLKGVSTHSFRRSILTKLHRAGYSLRTLQQITQHQDIGNLARYLDVGKEEADQAILAVWS